MASPAAPRVATLFPFETFVAVKAGKTTTTAKAAAPTRELMALFDTLHRDRFGVKACWSSLTGARDAAILKDLYRQRDADGDPLTVELLLREFFRSTDPWVLERGFTVPIFRTQVPKLVAKLAPTVKARGSRPANCACIPACVTAAAHTETYLRRL